MRALHPRLVRSLLEYFRADALNVQRAIGPKAWGDIVGKLEGALRPKRAAAPARKRRVARKETRREETARVREAVMARADGRCENPFCARHVGGCLELDHFWGGAGRRKAMESEEGCWALCIGCHRSKTRNAPDAAHWLKAFRWHAETHQRRAARTLADDLPWHEVAAMAQARLEALELQGKGAA